MATPAKRTLAKTLEDKIRKRLNKKAANETLELKWVLAGIKLEQMKKGIPQDQHGAGFDTIDDDGDTTDIEGGADDGDTES